MKRVFALLPAALLLASAAAADTPTFAELFDDEGRVMRVPVTFPADIGTVFVSAVDAVIDDDVSCDGLSTHALYVESAELGTPFEVRFLHDHPDEGGDDHLLGEREIFTLKMGAEEVDRYGATVGFASQGGFQFLPVQFGPASEGLADADLYGEIFVNGEPTGIRYANIFESRCSGADRQDGQVLVTFDMLGADEEYFITIQSNAPQPQRQTFGPFAIPDAVLEEGYGACMVRGQSGTGRMLLDGATCLVAAPNELLPINSERRTHRDSSRRR